jgi:uncharacterized small protein (TIGR04563 family)
MSDDCRDKRKQSLYFSEKLLAEIRAEARRLDRSFSWVVQYAWRHGGHAALQRLPTLETPTP